MKIKRDSNNWLQHDIAAPVAVVWGQRERKRILQTPVTLTSPLQLWMIYFKREKSNYFFNFIYFINKYFKFYFPTIYS